MQTELTDQLLLIQKSQISFSSPQHEILNATIYFGKE